jgi:hypothetical protein
MARTRDEARARALRHRPRSIIIACSSWASTSAAPASTRTAPSGRDWVSWAGRIPSSERSAPGVFECGLEARQMLYAGVVRTLEQYPPERVRALGDAIPRSGG